MTPFREILLNTSRVVWQPEPARTRDRITIHTDSRLALKRVYFSLLAYQDDREAEARARFWDAQECLTAAFLDPETRPAELAELPRNRGIINALKRGTRRLERVLEVAHRLVDHDGDALAVAAALTPRPDEWQPPPRRMDAWRRRVEPFLPMIHLALPLVAVRQPAAFTSRYPELAPSAVPRGLDKLFLSDRWPFAALDAAERWRQALPIEGLVEVRATWTGD